MIYTHVLNRGPAAVKSPADRMLGPMTPPAAFGAMHTGIRHIYIDTSAYKASRFPRDFVEYMRGPGRKKVLFGTNYPMLTVTECLEGIDQLGLDGRPTLCFSVAMLRAYSSLPKGRVVGGHP